jgi:spore coat protein JC
MWKYDKKLQYPIKIKKTDPRMAKVIMTQLGGPDGELGAAMRYLNQRYSCPYGQITGALTDIGTEESGQLCYQ